MSNRSLFLGAVVLATAGLASSAQATFFSFSSDRNSNAFTFAGTAGGTGAQAGSFGLTDFSRPNTYMLLVDDNNGPLATITIPIEFRANLTANAGRSTNIAGNLWQHSYLVTGTFGFYDTAGNALLTVVVGPQNAALLTVPGTQTAWSSTGAVLGANTFSDIAYTSTPAFITALGGAAIAQTYGVNGGLFGQPSDFAFDLSVINGGAIGLAVGIDATTKAPITAWRSESSYSGSAGGVIPSPGAAALLLGGGGILTAGRRRRTA